MTSAEQGQPGPPPVRPHQPPPAPPYQPPPAPPYQQLPGAFPFEPPAHPASGGLPPPASYDGDGSLETRTYGPSARSSGPFETPATAKDARAWLAFAVGGFVVGQVMSAIMLVAVAIANGHSRDLSQLASRTVPPGWVVVSGLIGLWFGFLGAVFFASHRRGTSSISRDMGLFFTGWDFLIGPAVGVGGQLVLLPILYLPVRHFVPHLSDKLSQSAKHLTGGFPGADLFVIALLTVLIVPVIEELLFRGLLLRSLLRLTDGAPRFAGPVISIVLTGLAFGLAHFELLQLLGLAAFGVVLSVMAYKFRRLGPSITAHATFNLIAILAVASTGSLIKP